MWLVGTKVSRLFALSKNVTIFGILKEDKNMDFLLNVFLILGKFFIHKCRRLEIQPLLVIFKKELKLYCRSVELVEKKAAERLADMISALNLFDESL